MTAEEFISGRNAVRSAQADYSSFAIVGFLALIAYVLLFDANVALFAILFLLLAIFYNPTKIKLGHERFSSDSDIIL